MFICIIIIVCVYKVKSFLANITNISYIVCQIQNVYVIFYLTVYIIHIYYFSILWYLKLFPLVEYERYTTENIIVHEYVSIIRIIFLKLDFLVKVIEYFFKVMEYFLKLQMHTEIGFTEGLYSFQRNYFLHILIWSHTCSTY